MRSTLLRKAVAFSLGALALGGAGERAAHAEGEQNHVRDVRVGAAGAAASADPGASEVTIVTTGAPRFSARVVDGGKRLLVDLAGADVQGAPEALTDRVGVVGGVLTQPFGEGEQRSTRVAITLAHQAAYRIRPEGNVLHVVLTPAEKTEAVDLLTSRVDQKLPRASSDPSGLRDVRFRRAGGWETVTLEVPGAVGWEAQTPSPTKTRLELRGARLPRELERTLDVSSLGGAVKNVATFRTGERIIVEVEHRSDVVGRVTRDGDALVWAFARPSQFASSETGIGPDGGAARRSRTVARDETVGDMPEVETSVRADSFAVAPKETHGGAAQAGALLPNVVAQAAGKFTGRRIDLDLKDADVHNVLRLLSEVGKVNVVTADNVAGSVTIRMRNVPWDQALEVVLQAKGLGMVRGGNLIRVAPLADLEKEREMAIARRKQELELAPLETRLVPVSYATANEVVARAQPMLSPRGSATVDERTNVIIVKDVGGNISQYEELVRALDTQTPQVLIEARIVEATSRYLRDVGIQWGGDATMSAATGNPTGLAFPSSATLAGGATDGSAPTAGLSPFSRTVDTPNYAVNLPAAAGTGSGGAIGFQFGSLNNNVHLALRLSAAETSGMVRIVSSPRVLTTDNHLARIVQGTLLPFAQVSAAGVNTVFQEARLQLQVKPHVTADGSVSMHVKVNRDEPDFNQTGPRGDPTILKREAETDLLVMDGHTAVIGGIFTRNTGRSVDQVPFFGDIPLLGLLFQRRRATDTRGELVIFITPRIVNRAEALGR